MLGLPCSLWHCLIFDWPASWDPILWDDQPWARGYHTSSLGPHAPEWVRKERSGPLGPSPMGHILHSYVPSSHQIISRNLQEPQNPATWDQEWSLKLFLKVRKMSPFLQAHTTVTWDWWGVNIFFKIIVASPICRIEKCQPSFLRRLGDLFVKILEGISMRREISTKSQSCWPAYLKICYVLSKHLG